MPLALMTVTRDGKNISLLALRPDDGIQAIGPHAVVGQMDPGPDGQPLWATFRRNKTFVDFFTRFMRGQLPDRPALLEGEARVKPGEFLYVIDPRVGSADGEVAFAEIVGWYRTDPSGSPIASSFEYNSDHLLVRSDGVESGILREANLASAVGRSAIA